MDVRLRSYSGSVDFAGDYAPLRNFLAQLNEPNYLPGRWDWMYTHPNLEADGLTRIGLWEEAGRVVALATYDTQLGRAHLLRLPGYEEPALLHSMLEYARQHLSKAGCFEVLIADGDRPLQQAAASLGYHPTQDGERCAYCPLTETSPSRPLPPGYSLISLAERCDIYQYGRVLWRGFGHEQRGEGRYAPGPDDLAQMEQALLRPNVDLSLKLAAVAPDGGFVAYCGTWLSPDGQSALVEPVATDPDFRRMGLGRAVVMEALHRCAQLGARRAFVGSSQQFYYAIGFRPYATHTWWRPRERLPF